MKLNAAAAFIWRGTWPARANPSYERQKKHWEADIETAVAVALITVAGGWFGVWVHHRLADWRDRRNSLRPHVAEFKAAFAEEIAAVREDLKPEFMLRRALPRHTEAVNKILPLLGKRDRRSLQRAWDEYRRADKGLDPEAGVTSYEHPDFRELGKHRFTALHSCLDHLVQL